VILESRVHWFAFQRQDAEGALVHTPERLAADEPLQALHAKSELAVREPAFPREATLAQALQMLG
jgi:hypothetical protein